MSTSGEGKGSSKQFSMPPADVLEECNYALTAMMNGGVVVRRVKTDFSRGAR